MKTTDRISRLPHGRFREKTIVLGVTGSVAAYKAVSLARRLMAEGAAVRVVMTRTAQRFIGPLTFEALTGQPVGVELFPASDAEGGVGGIGVMPHLALGEAADLIAIAPASAHCVAKLAHGLADDLL